MFRHLKDVFPIISVYLLFAMVILNILEYIRVLLKFLLPLRIYRQPLYCLNLIYIVSSIRKSGFKDLDFFILNGSAVGKILKTIMFVDKIDNVIVMAKYLRSMLSKCIQKKKRPNYIIHTFMANFTTISKTRFLANFFLSETWIWICTKYADMGINLSDIFRVI